MSNIFSVMPFWTLGDYPFFNFAIIRSAENKFCSNAVRLLSQFYDLAYNIKLMFKKPINLKILFWNERIESCLVISIQDRIQG